MINRIVLCVIASVITAVVSFAVLAAIFSCIAYCVFQSRISDHNREKCHIEVKVRKAEEKLEKLTRGYESKEWERESDKEKAARVAVEKETLESTLSAANRTISTQNNELGHMDNIKEDLAKKKRTIEGLRTENERLVSQARDLQIRAPQFKEGQESLKKFYRGGHQVVVTCDGQELGPLKYIGDDDHKSFYSGLPNGDMIALPGPYSMDEHGHGYHKWQQYLNEEMHFANRCRKAGLEAHDMRKVDLYIDDKIVPALVMPSFDKLAEGGGKQIRTNRHAVGVSNGDSVLFGGTEYLGDSMHLGNLMKPIVNDILRALLNGISLKSKDNASFIIQNTRRSTAYSDVTSRMCTDRGQVIRLLFSDFSYAIPKVDYTAPRFEILDSSGNCSGDNFYLTNLVYDQIGYAANSLAYSITEEEERVISEQRLNNGGLYRRTCQETVKDSYSRIYVAMVREASERLADMVNGLSMEERAKRFLVIGGGRLIVPPSVEASGSSSSSVGGGASHTRGTVGTPSSHSS